MSRKRNEGKFIARESETYSNGDKAIIDAFMLDDGTVVFHVYNVTADGRAHSHQIIDEYGKHWYARKISEDPRHPWIELDRMIATRWLETLSEDKLILALGLMTKMDLTNILELISFPQMENEKVKVLKNVKE